MPDSRTPHVSILMPVRNEERFLPAALRSLYAQTLTDWELVVVDDGSTDATPEILAAAAAKDGRIRVLANFGKGLVPALNHGFAACRAELIARMDGDDICHPRRLELQAAFMTDHRQVGLVACRFGQFPEKSLRLGMRAYDEWQNSLNSHEPVMRDRCVESPFVHPSVMLRREVLRAADGYRDMGWAEDYDLWLRLADAGVRFARLEETLFFWRDRPERATRTMSEYTSDAFRACKAHHLRHGFLKGVDRVILAGAGKEGRAWCRTLAAEGVAVACWVDVDPRKKGRELHGAPIFSPDEIVPGNDRMLITVGTRGAREGIRRWADCAGFVEGVDYVCVT